jgi:hypothetical protein
MKTTPQGKNPISPRKVINIKGKVHYSESNQAWNTIKLKSEFLNEFNKLKKKRSTFSYEMQYFRDPLDFEELLKKLKKSSVGLPVLMWFYEE